MDTLQKRAPYRKVPKQRPPTPKLKTRMRAEGDQAEAGHAAPPQAARAHLGGFLKEGWAHLGDSYKREYCIFVFKGYP